MELLVGVDVELPKRVLVHVPPVLADALVAMAVEDEIAVRLGGAQELRKRLHAILALLAADAHLPGRGAGRLGGVGSGLGCNCLLGDKSATRPFRLFLRLAGNIYQPQQLKRDQWGSPRRQRCWQVGPRW